MIYLIMVIIRYYTEADSVKVGKLIADVYSAYNLSFAPAEEKIKLLGPFALARSSDAQHKKAIEDAIRTETILVAEEDNNIVGVLRGKAGRLQSLFVHGDYHRHGIGRNLVGKFETACINSGGNSIKVASTLYAVPFYIKIGYKKTTGIRPAWSFGGTGLLYQPMKKILASSYDIT